MARVAIEPSAAVARMLRQRRRELGLSLRQVAEQTRAYGRPIPFTSLANIERGTNEAPSVDQLMAEMRQAEEFARAKALDDQRENRREAARPGETGPGCSPSCRRCSTTGTIPSSS